MGQIPSRLFVYPFTFSTQNLSFGEWVTMFTISLTPLIVHIAAGTPYPSILTRRKSRGPRWHDSMCLHNPTSILWRYAAILDRRLRAKEWSAVDMAAANAIFWTNISTRKRRTAAPTGYTTVGGGDESNEMRSPQQAQDIEHARREDEHYEEHGSWNGTEEMVLASLPYCTQLPLHTRARLFSWETIQTVIITLQGVQSLFYLFRGLKRDIEDTNTGLQDGVDKIFSPFTIFGLFRLCAAGYLTSTGFAYRAIDNVWMVSTAKMADEHAKAAETGGRGATTTPIQVPNGHNHVQHDSYDYVTHEMAVLNNDPGSSTMVDGARYYSTNYIPSILFRCAYMLLLLLTWALSILRGTPTQTGDSKVWVRSITTVLCGAFYTFFTSCTCVLFAVYLWRGATRSTIIPCVGTMWYKIYTLIVFAGMVAMLVVACCETSKMPCGQYTSLGQEYWNETMNCDYDF